MENRCRRCNRKLSDPNADYGWRCAEILGVSDVLSKMGEDVFKKFADGVMKAERLFGKSNIQFTDERRKNLYSAFAKMSLWDGVNDKKVKEARRESYGVINSIKTKIQSFADTLKEYKEHTDKYGLIPGISKKLANDGKLDDVTNAILKGHDIIWGNTKTAFGIGDERANTDSPKDLYDYFHTAVALKNYIHNQKVDLSNYKNSYINDQNTGTVSKLKLGFDTMDNNGCEVIAAYNAMKSLGKQKDIRDIAYYFENDGQMLGGKFGTNPYSIKRYFEGEGYEVKVIEGEKITEEKLPKADAYIISFWNSDNVIDALHTVAMRKTQDCKYELFNYAPWTKKSKVVENLGEELLDEGIVPLSAYCISK